jgi:hypothetical protein
MANLNVCLDSNLESAKTDEEIIEAINKTFDQIEAECYEKCNKIIINLFI